MKRLKGFTLVELLVVIGIIALLMGILMPALNSAREHGNGTTFSFADGHCDYRKWRDPRTVEFGLKETTNSEIQRDNDDIRWTSFGCWGSAAGR